MPAVVVSPFIAPGTVFRSTTEQPFDHTSIIRTLRKRFGIAQSLTARDAAAPDLESVLNLPTPSNGGPQSVQGRAAPPQDDDEALEHARLAPLNDFQKAMHDAAGYLAPLIHGVTPENHIAALAQGYQPAPSDPSNAIDALQGIRNLVGKLLG